MAARTDVPRGTVPFLFTDIAGSTRLWREHRMPFGNQRRQRSKIDGTAGLSSALSADCPVRDVRLVRVVRWPLSSMTAVRSDRRRRGGAALPPDGEIGGGDAEGAAMLAGGELAPIDQRMVRSLTEVSSAASRAVNGGADTMRQLLTPEHDDHSSRA